MRKKIKKFIAIFAVFLLLLPVVNVQPILAESTLEDGEYTIDFRVLKNGTDDISTMDGYTVKPAGLTVQDGKTYISVTLKSSEWIKTFQVERNGEYVDAEVVSVNEEENTRVVKFEVDDLTKKLNVQTRVSVPGVYDTIHTVQFQFDVQSVAPVQTEPPGEGGQAPENPGNEPGTNNPGDNPANGDNPSPGNDEPRNELADGLYTVEFIVLKHGTDDPSMVNDYVVSPALLTVKNGQMDVAFTLLKSSWITQLQVERNGQYQDVEVRSKNEKQDTRVVGFPIEDLSKKVNAKIKVDIPDLQYQNTYDIQFAFDPDSIKPYKGTSAPTTDPNGQDQQNGADDDDPLTFNRDADQQPKDGDTADPSDSSVLNAKTADISQLGLYLAMLMGSLSVILWKNRSRFLLRLKE